MKSDIEFLIELVKDASLIINNLKRMADFDCKILFHILSITSSFV